MNNTDWHIFKKDGKPNSKWSLPDPPSWRAPSKENGSDGRRDHHRGETFQPSDTVIEMVNAALYLRRPLLITGKPGTGKSSVAYAVALQLMLGEVLHWPITTRTTLKSGLYDYDAIGRLQDAKQLSEKGDDMAFLDLAGYDFRAKRLDFQELGVLQLHRNRYSSRNSTEELANIGSYITLGPLGTALIPSNKPRVLLIDEIDKSDIDLPNDLLTILEEGRFEIPELVRIKEKVPEVSVRTAYTDSKEIEKFTVFNGRITCKEFPFVVLTSNGERAFPPAFLRRCLRLHMQVPESDDELEKIVKAHLSKELEDRKKQIAEKEGQKAAEDWYEKTDKEQNKLIKKLITSFLEKRKEGDIATDQLLNAIFMVTREKGIDSEEGLIKKFLMKPLTSNEDI